MRLIQPGVAAIAILLAPALTLARTVHVPGGHPTITAGLAHAGSGDTVLVAPGIYHEWDLQIPSGALLLSESGPEVTVIDGPGPYVPIPGNLITGSGRR